jgi:hypothetical protein
MFGFLIRPQKQTNMPAGDIVTNVLKALVRELHTSVCDSQHNEKFYTHECVFGK